jgi:hypothetical protein
MAIMHSDEDRTIPGNALALQAKALSLHTALVEPIVTLFSPGFHAFRHAFFTTFERHLNAMFPPSTGRQALPLSCHVWNRFSLQIRGTQPVCVGGATPPSCKRHFNAIRPSSPSRRRAARQAFSSASLSSTLPACFLGKNNASADNTTFPVSRSGLRSVRIAFSCSLTLIR